MSNVSYTYTNLAAAAKHAAALASPQTDFDTGNAVSVIVNNAIQFLCAQNEWSWLRKPLILNFTAATISSIVRASNVLTIQSLSHGLAVGDFIRITGSTSADGEYYVSVVDTIHQFKVNQTGSDETLATAGTFIRGFVALDADFMGILNLQRNSQIRTVFATSMNRISRYRTSGGIFFTGPTGFYYAVRTIPQTSATAAPTKHLELYPTPTAAETAALVGEYRRQIPSLSGTNDIPDIGTDGMLHTALITLVRAMAVSSEEDRAGEDWRVFERMLPMCIARDGDEQANLGLLEGGVLDQEMEVDHLYPTRISPAS